MFDINIECDKSTHEYYIEDSEDLKKGALRNWLLSTFSVNNLLSESQKFRERIMFENIPSGQGYLAAIIEAMKVEVVVKVAEGVWGYVSDVDGKVLKPITKCEYGMHIIYILTEKPIWCRNIVIFAEIIS